MGDIHLGTTYPSRAAHPRFNSDERGKMNFWFTGYVQEHIRAGFGIGRFIWTILGLFGMVLFSLLLIFYAPWWVWVFLLACLVVALVAIWSEFSKTKDTV